MKTIHFVNKNVRKFFSIKKWMCLWRPRTIVVVFFAFVLLGHVSYIGGDVIFATAHASIEDEFMSVINWALYNLARLFGLMGVAGATLFVYVLDAGTVNQILNSPVIDVIWTIVRDVLNLAFILILLFSAFATIFQVERYHLRNILVRLVIMALLVNFSLPIAKVIIDASNILMYFFVNNLFPRTTTGFEIPEIFGKSINIIDVFIPQKEKAEQTFGYILMALIFAFFYGISMITIAGLLVVRLVALAILMIFSPIGFVAMILPATQTYAQEWWSKLFKYAFNGPILIFMLFFSMSFMAYTHDMAFNIESDQRIIKPTDTATTDAAQSSNMTNLVFLMIPIVILWSGIIMTSTASDGASKMVTGFGQGIARKVGRGLKKGTYAGGKGLARRADYHTGAHVAAARIRMKNFVNKFDNKYRSRAEGKAATPIIAKAATKSAAKLKQFNKELAESTKKLKDIGADKSQEQLKDIVANGSDDKERMAAARLLAEGGMMDLKTLNIATSDNFIKSAPENARNEFVNSIERNVKNNGQRALLAQHKIVNNQEDVDVVINEVFDVSADTLAKEKGDNFGDSINALKEVDEGAAKKIINHLENNVLDTPDNINQFSRKSSATLKGVMKEHSRRYDKATGNTGPVPEKKKDVVSDEKKLAEKQKKAKDKKARRADSKNV